MFYEILQFGAKMYRIPTNLSKCTIKCFKKQKDGSYEKTDESFIRDGQRYGKCQKCNSTYRDNTYGAVFPEYELKRCGTLDYRERFETDIVMKDNK